jgi:hypothetical protein
MSIARPKNTGEWDLARSEPALVAAVSTHRLSRLPRSEGDSGHRNLAEHYGRARKRASGA